jgi:DNA-binding NtrC family response regulator
MGKMESRPEIGSPIGVAVSNTMRILVLEIKPLSLLIKHMLSRFSYDADVTPDIAEALQWYNERAPYDVVLADVPPSLERENRYANHCPQ